MRKRTERIVAVAICILSLSVLAPVQTGWAEGPSNTVVATSGAILQTTRAGYGISGAVCDNTGGDWGSYILEPQLDIFAEAGGKSIKFVCNWYRWLTDETTWTPSPYSYRDYIKQLCDWCAEKGLHAYLGLYTSYSWSAPPEEKEAVITNSPYYIQAYGETRPYPQDDWIAWGEAMIAYCDPYGIDVMSEHTSLVTFTEYRNFCIASIEAYRTIKPDLHIIVEAYRNNQYRDGRLSYRSRFDDWMTDPLPYNNILYDIHRYWLSSNMPELEPSTTSFMNGEYEQGRAELWDYFDYLLKIGDYYDPATLYPNVIIGEWGSYEYYGQGVPEYHPNWNLASQAFYEWCQYRDVPFLQWSYARSMWGIIEDDLQNLEPSGQLWADNLVSP